jgi:hypothetical protein
VQMRDFPTVGGFCQDQTSSADRATGAALQSEGCDRRSAEVLNNKLLRLQVHEWRCGLSGGRSERPENRTPGCVGLHSPGGALHPILLRKEYGGVIAEPGAETWPIQVIEVLYEPHKEFSDRGRCDVQNPFLFNVARTQFRISLRNQVVGLFLPAYAPPSV